MSHVKVIVLSTVTVCAVLMWSGYSVIDHRDPLLEDVERLASSFKLNPVAIEAGGNPYEWPGVTVARFESKTLTEEDKTRLWRDYVKTMAKYGQPMGPTCGTFAASYVLAGLELPYYGSGRVGLRRYSYVLEETMEESPTVILELTCRVDQINDVAGRITGLYR